MRKSWSRLVDDLSSLGLEKPEWVEYSKEGMFLKGFLSVVGESIDEQ